MGNKLKICIYFNITLKFYRLFSDDFGGFFFEAGAMDGEFLSNTLELERKFGWHGILVEADPTLAVELRYTI